MPYTKAKSTTTRKKPAAKKTTAKKPFKPCASCRTLSACKKAGKCKAGKSGY